MIKNCLFGAALLSLALAGGCAKGGNGEGSGITVTIGGDITVIYPNQSVTFTAKVTPATTSQTVTWSLIGKGSECTGTPSPCGTIDRNSGVYTAPGAPPTPPSVTIIATSAADNLATGELPVSIQLVTVVVTPTAVTVGENLVQQFTAVALPDDAPQTFTWSCTPTGACGSFAPNPDNLDAAVYTAPSSTGSVFVTATSTLPSSEAVSGQTKVSVVASRLASGTYAFRFSGYDSSGNPVSAAGTLTAGASGITGVEDVLNASGPQPFTIIPDYSVSGSSCTSSYAPTNNSLGKLTLCLNSGATYITNTYTAVLTSSDIIRMIESDTTGTTGSGVMQKSAAKTVFNNGAQTFVFGFTGVDLSGNRVGYAGLLPMIPNGTGGTITGGLLDMNDSGTASSYSNVTGTYTLNANGVWQMTLDFGTTTLYFDFYVSAGTAQTTTGPNPLTLYAISTENPADPTQPQPAVSGSMVYQVPMTYNNAAFSGTSVSNLTGANANVSLTLGTTDGTSGGTGGAGGFTGTFDWNNGGTTIVSVPPASPFSYTYVANSSNTGRYTFQMLGNPTVNPAQAPLPFILYASGANRGFLLDQSSSAVMTGTMDPQPEQVVDSYAFSELPGVYAAATISNSDFSVTPVVENLLLTSPGGTPPVYSVAGTLNPGNQALNGAYTITLTGTGTITLPTPPPQAAATNVIYAIDFDATNQVITDFMMMGTCTPQAPATTCSSGPASSIIFAQQ